MTYRIWPYVRIQSRAQEARQGFAQGHCCTVTESYYGYLRQRRQRQSQVEQRAVGPPGKRHRNCPELAQATEVEHTPHPSTTPETCLDSCAKSSDPGRSSTSASSASSSTTITASAATPSPPAESKQRCCRRCSQRSLFQRARFDRWPEPTWHSACSSRKSRNNARQNSRWRHQLFGSNG
jgi:hypothetical protein